MVDRIIRILVFCYKVPSQGSSTGNWPHRSSSEDLWQVARVQTVGWSNRAHIFCAEHLTTLHVAHHEKRAPKPPACFFVGSRTELRHSKRFFRHSYRVN